MIYNWDEGYLDYWCDNFLLKMEVVVVDGVCIYVIIVYFDFVCIVDFQKVLGI